MDEYLLIYLKDKFKLSKIVKKNCLITLVSILKYSTEDIRVDYFRKFLGLGTQKIRTQIVDNFFILLKNLGFSFFKLFEDIDIVSDHTMSINDCCRIYKKHFPNSTIEFEIYEKLLNASEFIRDESHISILPINAKREIYFLKRYKEKFPDHFGNIVGNYKKNEEKLSFLELAEFVKFANDEYNINLDYIKEIFKRNFELQNDKMKMEKVVDYFLRDYSIKIKILDFVYITLEQLCIIYGEFERNLNSIMDNFLESKIKGIYFYKDFENLMDQIFSQNESKWKYPKYFKYNLYLFF
jgi:hypothetical protein